MPGLGTRFWIERTPAKRRRTYPTYRGDRTADVVVIGGGLTGCAAASVFARAGLEVVLLEADRLAGGSTAHSIGAILPEPDTTFLRVHASCGKKVARAAFKETRKAAREFAAALRRQKIACDLKPASFWINTDAATDEAVSLRREQAARKAAGLATSWAPARMVDAELGLASSGAIVARDAFTFDPVKAATGLAARATTAGAEIFERSPVRRTRFTRTEATVVLAKGTIRTTLVYVATGEPSTLFSQLRRHVTRQDGYVVITAPLSAAMRREVGRRDSVMTESGASPHWLRWLPDDRAMFAGAAGRSVAPRPREKAVRQQTAELMYELSVRYPVISGLPAAYGWDLPVVSTDDGLPWIGSHRNYPFHFFALASGWHGDSLAWFAARAALRFQNRQATRDDEAFGFLRRL